MNLSAYWNPKTHGKPFANYVLPKTVRRHLHTSVTEYLVTLVAPLAICAGKCGELSAFSCFAKDEEMRTR